MARSKTEDHPLDQEHYAFLNSQLRFRTEQVQGKFDLFIKIFSAVVAGSVWLSYQGDLTPGARAKFGLVSMLLVWWMTILCSAMILSHDGAWRGYRHAVVKHGPRYPDGTPKVPELTQKLHMRVELMMVFGMLIAAIAFTLFNPFTLEMRAHPANPATETAQRLDSRAHATDTPRP